MDKMDDDNKNEINEINEINENANNENNEINEINETGNIENIENIENEKKEEIVVNSDETDDETGDETGDEENDDVNEENDDVNEKNIEKRPSSPTDFSKNSIISISRKAGIKCISQCGIEKVKALLHDKIKTMSNHLASFYTGYGKTITKQIIIDFLDSEGIHFTHMVKE
jgi:hypothetical protein